MKRLLSILLITFISQSIFSQDASFNIDRKIQLKNQDSVEKNIKINVVEGTSNVYVSIECSVYLGDVTIEIFDPKGAKKGNFSIESQVEEEIPIRGNPNEIIEGQIEQRLEKPITGNWIIKITPKKASGKVDIKTNHHIFY